MKHGIGTAAKLDPALGLPSEIRSHRPSVKTVRPRSCHFDPTSDIAFLVADRLVVSASGVEVQRSNRLCNLALSQFMQRKTRLFRDRLYGGR